MASLQFLLASYAEATGRQPIGLLTLSGGGMLSTLRFCTGHANVISRGNLFQPLWFELRLPSIQDSSIRQGEIVMDNTGEEPIASMRTATKPVTLLFELVLANAPGDTAAIDRVEMTTKWSITPSASYSGAEFRARLGYATVLNDMWPQRKFVPNEWPGVFGLALMISQMLG